jgi:UDP-glucuronate decarboxylase
VTRRVLILGGAGFVGYHLARRLGEDGARAITIVDDLSRGRMDDELSALVRRPGVDFVQADLTDAAAWARLDRAWDQVYMLVAVVGVRNVEADPFRTIRVNTQSVLNLIEWLTPAAGTVFFSSTSEAYAGALGWSAFPVPTPENVPLAVGDIENPRFAYSASKILGEAAVIQGARARRVPYVVGRFHNVYGPRMGADHVIPELSLRALAREDPFRVYGVEQHRAFCHVADAVDAMTRLMAEPAAAGRIVNIGNDADETTIERLLALVLDVAGFAPTIDRRPAPAGSPARRCPDISRLRALTGFTPKVDLDVGVRQTFEWYRAWFDARKALR